MKHLCLKLIVAATASFLMLSSYAYAGPVFTLDLTSPLSITPNQGTVGNTYSETFTGPNGNDVTVDVSAISLIGGTVLESSILQAFTQGLGVCNSSEVLGGCSGSSPDFDHTVDNGGSEDYVVFKFSHSIQSARIDLSAFGDTDVVYFSGNSASGPDFFNLTHQGNSEGDHFDRTVNLDLSPNGDTRWIFFGADADHTLAFNDDQDRFKIKAVHFEAPIPPVVVLFGTGLAGLIGLARRKNLINK